MSRHLRHAQLGKSDRWRPLVSRKVKSAWSACAARRPHGGARTGEPSRARLREEVLPRLLHRVPGDDDLRADVREVLNGLGDFLLVLFGHVDGIEVAVLRGVDQRTADRFALGGELVLVAGMVHVGVFLSDEVRELSAQSYLAESGEQHRGAWALRVLLVELSAAGGNETAVDATSLAGKGKPTQDGSRTNTVQVASVERSGVRRRTLDRETRRGLPLPPSVGTAAKLQAWPPSVRRTLTSIVAAAGHFRTRLAIKALKARV